MTATIATITILLLLSSAIAIYRFLLVRFVAALMNLSNAMLITLVGW